MGFQNRVEQSIEENAYISIKKHKGKFSEKLWSRLISSGKYEIRKTIKDILDKL